MKTIVFSDVDGTLLNDQHMVMPETIEAIHSLNQQGISFVIVSARSPSGIYPILRKNDFNCNIIAYSGGLILDEQRNVIESRGFTQSYAKKIIDYIKAEGFDCTVNIYSGDDWLVEKKDSRVLREESIVEAEAAIGSIDDLSLDTTINKILCMCNPEKTIAIEKKLKAQFKEVEIAKSSDILIEINGKGITKAHAVKKICEIYDVPVTDTIAFGDNYNDQDMLQTVGHPFLMANAPVELLTKIPHHTDDNNHEGIAKALKKLGLI